ncbi:hypothetical protein DM860_015132 [Cuscuta australis]|uniref:Uncharacterized protein n=1 Tax=Cuscuta australis TaxID=267555 RepID=A0A328DBJ9_9ASTE|nr:hypothetical protein DM860_015132 [Cuscuta australis]
MDMGMTVVRRPPTAAASKHPFIFSPIAAADKPGLRIPYRHPRVATPISISRASDPKREAPNTESGRRRNPAFVPQEDLEYLVKLGAGSVVAAAAIKYGSIVFPAATSPNLAESTAIITAPVIVAIALLVKQSRADR